MLRTPRHTSRGALVGMCFGAAVGCAVGFVFGGLSTGFGLCVGIAVGAAIGSVSDLRSNARLEENTYTVRTMLYADGEYTVILADPAGKEYAVPVPKSVFHPEEFREGDLVILEQNDVLLAKPVEKGWNLTEEEENTEEKE